MKEYFTQDSMMMADVLNSAMHNSSSKEN